MESARLDRQITIQRRTVTLSDLGEPVETWGTLATRRAEYVPVAGDERFGGDAWIAKQQVEFRVRWDESIADLSPLDRVIYPVGTPTDANTYDVMAVLPNDAQPQVTRSRFTRVAAGRNQLLRIMAARRSDSGP